MEHKVSAGFDIGQSEEEIIQENFEADLKNAELELERNTQSLVEHEFVLSMQRKQLEAYKAAKDVIIEFCNPITPVYEYETKEAYKEYYKVAQELKIEQEMFKLEQQSIPGMERTVKAKKEAIESLNAKIVLMKGD